MGILDILNSGDFSGLAKLFGRGGASPDAAPPARPDPAATADAAKQNSTDIALAGLKQLAPTAPAAPQAAPLGISPNHVGQVAPLMSYQPIALAQLSTPLQHMARGGIASLARGAGSPATSLNDKAITSHAILALKGRHPNPTHALAHYLRRYGTGPFRDLVDHVQSGTPMRHHGKISGPGDGMSDNVPAQGPGGSDVMLANGEYVVPADVVSGLGNGSTDAGAKHLKHMADRVRTQRTGKLAQPAALDPKDVLPA